MTSTTVQIEKEMSDKFHDYVLNPSPRNFLVLTSVVVEYQETFNCEKEIEVNYGEYNHDYGIDDYYDKLSERDQAWMDDNHYDYTHGEF